MDNLPNHIAIIMDGNGRWAKKRMLTHNAGHRAGGQALKKLILKMNENGFKTLTVFAFSSENWKRSPAEVAGLMDLMRGYIQEYIDDNEKNNIRINVIGDMSRLDDDLRRRIENLKSITRNNGGMLLNIAINYGGRDDIVRAAGTLAARAASGEIKAADIDENVFSSCLDTRGEPDPDLLIRTSGEMRISNFLLWQLAYSELYFSDKLWPDFTFDDLMTAVEKFRGRERRFGGRK